MKKNKIIFILMAVFLISALFLGCENKDTKTNKDDILVQYYYFNVCGSCQPEEDFLDKFEDLTGISLKTPNLQVEMFNVKEESAMAKWRETVQLFDVDTDSFPAIRINDDIHLSVDLDSEIINFSNEITKPIGVIPSYSSVMYYFYSPGCHDCETVREKVLDILPEQVEIDGKKSEVVIVKSSISDSEGLMLFKTYCEEYYVPEEKRMTPITFMGYRAFAGIDEIYELEEALLEGQGLDTPVLEVKANEGGLGGGYGLFSVISTGLLNGINPCSVSMMLMILSLIAFDKKKIYMIGLPFVVGKFIGFLLLGTILYKTLSIINFKGLSLVAKITLMMFAGVFAILNFIDFLAAKNEKYQKIKLQLPKRLRKYNHEWIKKITSTKKSGMIIAGGFALGLILSCGEFLCTGQLYLAVILHSVHSGIGFSARAVLNLVLYSVTFIIPLLVLVLLIAKGRGVFEIGDKFRNNMMWIKLGNAIIFIAFFVIAAFIY